jgi:hypothetical protein
MPEYPAWNQVVLWLGRTQLLGTVKQPLDRPQGRLVEWKDSGTESVLAHLHCLGLSFQVNVTEPHIPQLHPNRQWCSR